MRYNDEEYKNLIKREPGWSRQETDYLLELCARFELRFPVIADRYEVWPAAASTVCAIGTVDACWWLLQAGCLDYAEHADIMSLQD
jgi:hypothetical protein